MAPSLPLLLLPFRSPIQALNPLPAASPRLHPPSKPLALSLFPDQLSPLPLRSLSPPSTTTKRMSSSETASCSRTTPSSPRPRPPVAATDHLSPQTEVSGGEAGVGESLVPERWRDAAEEINLTKKEKRRIAHGLRFGSRLERRPPPAVAAPDEYLAYREGRLDAELGNAARDHVEPVEMPRAPEKVEAPLPPEPGTRVAPRNPRMGIGVGNLEDVAELFRSGEYVPGDREDGKSARNMFGLSDETLVWSRKLFTDEEKVLLNKRVPDLEAATSSKWLPLHTLSASGDFYLLDNLLKHNVDINTLDKDGLPAIHKAILSKKHAIINYLLRNSANPFIHDKDGATLMHYAVQTACSQTIKTLLLYNVDINRPDDYGWTPLHLAMQTQRTDIVKLLLIKGADRTLKTQDGLTPLDLCLRLGHHVRTYELIKLLKSFRLPK